MGQKRILVYTESFIPSIGGLENNTLLLCDTLCSLGHHVTLLTPQKDASLQNNYQVIETKSVISYFRVVLSHNLVLVNGGVSFKMILPCLMCFKSYLIIYQMASLWKNIHDGSFFTKVGNFLRYILAKIAQSNIGVSQYSYEELKRTFGIKKSAILTNPADPQFKPTLLAQKSSLKPFVCLMAGRLIEGKGINLLLQAIIELNGMGYSIHLHFIGDGSDKENITSKPHPNIFLHHSMSKLELSEWIKKAHLTIIPSTTHIEGSPLIMAESLILGTPVLVSSQPAMIESIQKDSLVFESGDVLSLKIKIIQLLDKANYQEILDHCHQIADDFSYHRYLDRLKNIIANV